MLSSKTNFNALNNFKFKAFSLLAAFFLSFFLVGCGSSSDKDDEGQKPLPSVESSFPDFSNVTSLGSQKYIAYDKVSEADFNKTIEEAIAVDFRDCGDDAVKECTLMPDGSTGIYRAYTGGGSSSDLSIAERGYVAVKSLFKDGADEIDDAFFETLFPAINGREAIVATVKFFSATDVTLKQADYIQALEADGFAFVPSNHTYTKSKDGVTYEVLVNKINDNITAVMWVVMRDDIDFTEVSYLYTQYFS